MSIGSPTRFFINNNSAEHAASPVQLPRINRTHRNQEIIVKLPKPQEGDRVVNKASGFRGTEASINATSGLQLSAASSVTPKPPLRSLGSSRTRFRLQNPTARAVTYKAEKSLFSRGTRGRGDPRNAAMKAARTRFLAERRLEEAKEQQGGSYDGIGPNVSDRLGKSAGSSHYRRSNVAQQKEKTDLRNSKLSHEVSAQSPRIGPSIPNYKGKGYAPGSRSSRSSPGKELNDIDRHPSVRHFSSFKDQNQPHGAIWRRPNDWTTWNELRIKIYGLTPNVSTRDLWMAFHREGSIASIEIFDDARGNRDGKAIVRFIPPPPKAFWQVKDYRIFVKGGKYTQEVPVRLELERPRRAFSVESPFGQQKEYPELMTLNAESIDFGFMYDQITMMSMHGIVSSSEATITFRQSLRHREIVVEFQLNIRDPRARKDGNPVPNFGKLDRSETLRFSIPFAQLHIIYQKPLDENLKGLLIPLETPPKIFRKLDEKSTHEENGRYWNQNDAWYRQTDVIYDPGSIKRSPLALKKSLPIIDIGRWTTYWFVFDMRKNDPTQYDKMCEAFRDHNVKIASFPDFKLGTKRKPAVWEFVDKPLNRMKKNNSIIDEFKRETIPALGFPVRYQLEVCIAYGYLNEHNLTKEFVHSLASMDEAVAQAVLEFVATRKERVYDPMEIFNFNIVKDLKSKAKLPNYCTYSRSATVTPSTIYFNTPTVETSNRVVRRYSEHSDRFLRVRFTDEKFEGKIHPTTKDTMNEVFTRVKRAMNNGIVIGDRRYMFLAFGNSQFREHGAYFFAELPHLTTEKIRSWMGSFKHIDVVALYAARIGQCFSTTRAIQGSKVSVVEIKDIERNGHCFTDGVGKISPFLAHVAASELGILQSHGRPPSVFQFRHEGQKGVLALSPAAKKNEIHVRKSQYKFPASHECLEIIRSSQFASATLNRQMIVVLSTLGVPDMTFIQKLKLQLSSLEKAMIDEKMALSLLQKDIDANQMTLNLAGMIIDGFQRFQEPFLMSLLQLWRAWSIKYLKEKARIYIPDGALLLGCVDETGSLRGHFNDDSNAQRDTSQFEKEKLLPEVFVQLSKGPGNIPYVVKGPMLLARNPSLHPGDIRVVRGVDVPELRHLKDVVVFPQTGDRDIPSMCSGGDLDGDDYLVMWDKELLEHEWNHEPMDYTPPPPIKVAAGQSIGPDDITSFFVTYMKNDTLPTIAHAHLAQADFADDGVKDEKCLKLASLHSMAVDYVKTGEPARMPRELHPKKWPHFMEKNYKPKEQTYRSTKVLGQLYDQVERVDFVPAFTAPFDNRILNACETSPNMLREAVALKAEYDAALHRIMAQHDIKTEFEVWSTFVLHHSNECKDYKFSEVIGELSAALKDQFRKACYEKAGGKGFEHIGPFAVAMYKVTHEQSTRAVEKYSQIIIGRPVEELSKKMPFMSFPWLFQAILGKIANGMMPFSKKKDVTATLATSNSVGRDTSKETSVAPKMSEMYVLDASTMLNSMQGDAAAKSYGKTTSPEGPDPSNYLLDIESSAGCTVAPLESDSNPIKPSNKTASPTVDELLFGDHTPYFHDGLIGNQVSQQNSRDNLVTESNEALFTAFDNDQNSITNDNLLTFSSEPAQSTKPTERKEWKNTSQLTDQLDGPIKKPANEGASSTKVAEAVQDMASDDDDEIEVVNLPVKGALLDRLVGW